MADPDWDSSEDMDAEDQERTIEKLEAEKQTPREGKPGTLIRAKSADGRSTAIRG